MSRVNLIASLAVVVCLGSASGALGQGVQVGGRIGLVVSSLGGDASYDTELRFSGGIFGGIELSRKIGFYPELGYVSKGGHAESAAMTVTPEGDLQQLTLTETVSLRYLELYLPVAFQVPLDPGSVELRFYTGPALAVELDCSGEVEERVETVSPSGERLDLTEGLRASGGCGREGGDPPVSLFTETDNLDFGLAFGIGIDIAFGGGVLSGDVRYDLGLKDITAGRDVSLRNRAFQVLVGYSRYIGRG